MCTGSVKEVVVRGRCGPFESPQHWDWPLLTLWIGLPEPEHGLKVRGHCFVHLCLEKLYVCIIDLC